MPARQSIVDEKDLVPAKPAALVFVLGDANAANSW